MEVLVRKISGVLLVSSVPWLNSKDVVSEKQGRVQFQIP